MQGTQKSDIANVGGDTLDAVSTSTPTKQTPPVSVGGSKDSHGCVLGGGYTWDASMNACVRSWEKLSVLIPSKKWYLVNSDGSISETVYFQTNAEGTNVSGKACNSFSGSIKIDNRASTVYISNTMSTLMACTDDYITAIESKLFGITNGTVKVTLNADTGHIILSSAVTSMKMEFAPKDK